MTTSRALGTGRILASFGLLVAAVTVLHGQGAASPADAAPPGSLAALAREVAQLKVQVVQIRLELEQARIARQEHELEEVKEKLQSLATEEESASQEVEDLQRQLLDPGLTNEQRAIIAATVTEASTQGLTSLDEERLLAEQRRAALQEQLSQSYSARSRLLEGAAALGILVPEGTSR